jgi:uncharacterized membrane protein YfcA
VSAIRLLLLGGVGLVTGAINTVAGGGSLLSFPTLLALGYSPLVANVTNTIGVFPSSAGGVVGYRRELAGQARNWPLLAAVCTAGGLLGAWLLLVLPASSFEAAVPALIASAALLTLVQPWLARRLHGPGPQPPLAVGAGATRATRAAAAGTAGATGARAAGVGGAAGATGATGATGAAAAGARPAGPGAVAAGEPGPAARPLHRRWALLLGVLAISVYGGYFGAAIGVLLIAVLGLLLHDTLQRTNALKTSLTVVVNGVAGVAFAFLGPVVWSAALVLAGTTMVGGMLGAAIARRLSDRALRLAVVAIGLGAAVYSAVR